MSRPAAHFEVGVINTGIFTAAPGTVLLHWTLGFLLGLLPLVVVYAITGWQWRPMSGWRRYGWYSLATALGAVVLIVLSFVLLAPRSASGGPSSQIGGLIERVLVLVTFAWPVVIGWRLFRQPRLNQWGSSLMEEITSLGDERLGVPLLRMHVVALVQCRCRRPDPELADKCNCCTATLSNFSSCR